MPTPAIAPDLSCAVEVFLATALLHREQPARSDFTIQEIVSRAARENITGEMRSGVNVHASQHCVANKAPNPAKHRMLFATGKHTRRLLLPGDPALPGRTGKIFPDPDEVPHRYLGLLEWAKARYNSGGGPAEVAASASDPHGGESERAQRWLEALFELEGLGREHWKGVDPDQFVRELREGWE
jgi:hypothetical protein